MKEDQRESQEVPLIYGQDSPMPSSREQGHDPSRSASNAEENNEQLTEKPKSQGVRHTNSL